MRVLIACEYSGRVREAFRKRGHYAWSCDIKPALDGSIFHQITDVRKLLCEHKFDMIIAFPPCTHLSSSGARHWPEKRADGRQQDAINFFMNFANQACPWAIENPIGIMSTAYRKPDQIIQPYEFGDSAQKSTCLWLSGLPKLVPTKIVSPGEMHILPDGRKFPKWMANKGAHRNITFQGIADAMAAQWSSARNHRNKPRKTNENLSCGPLLTP